MNSGVESLTDLLFSFCSQPIPTEGVPDLCDLEEEEEDEFEHPDSQIDSPSSSQENVPKDSGSHPYKASPDFFNVPDLDDTEEHPTQSQRTPAPWPQRVRLDKIPDRRATLSGRESALEKAMKKYAVITTKLFSGARVIVVSEFSKDSKKINTRFNGALLVLMCV